MQILENRKNIEERNIDRELNFILLTVVPFSIVNLVFLAFLSESPYVFLILGICFLINVLFSKRKSFSRAYIIAVNIGIFFLASIYSSSSAPSWILFIPPLIPSIFLISGYRNKLIWVAVINFAAMLSSYVSGKDLVLICANGLALATFTTFIYRTFRYLDLQKSVIQKERQKSDFLLSNILPDSISGAMKEGETNIARHHEQASILFADIVGFTEFSELTPAKDLVSILSDIFTVFDELVENYSLEKIKTIGDAYMVAGGIPKLKEGHEIDMADFALDMQARLAEFNVQHGYHFDIRIGIHVGSVIAGVIGAKKFSYDVWGDTVNTASRMESHGVPGRIQVSEYAYHCLKEHFEFIKRGEIKVKGKGEMSTYFLTGSLDTGRHPEG